MEARSTTRAAAIVAVVALGIPGVAIGAPAQVRRPDPVSDEGIAARLHGLASKTLAGARVATTQAQAQPVQSLAHALVRLHETLGEELTAWAASNGDAILSVRGGMDDQANAMLAAGLERLRSTPSGPFDREYLSFVVRAHDHAIELVGRARDRVVSFDLRELLHSVLPALSEQRATARRLLREAEGTPLAVNSPAGPAQALTSDGLRKILSAASALADDDLAVTSEGSTFVLTGTVDSEAERGLAGDLARSHAGNTKLIDNRLRVVGVPQRLN